MPSITFPFKRVLRSNTCVNFTKLQLPQASKLGLAFRLDRWKVKSFNKWQKKNEFIIIFHNTYFFLHQDGHYKTEKLKVQRNKVECRGSGIGSSKQNKRRGGGGVVKQNECCTGVFTSCLTNYVQMDSAQGTQEKELRLCC
jgi:hypothetical protein